MTSPASGSHCARSFANRQTKSLAHKRTFVNLGYPRPPTISSNLRPQKMSTEWRRETQTSRPEWKLIETTTSPVLQMKWKRTFSTTTWDQHFVPLRRLQDRSNLNQSCPASRKWTAHHGAPMRRLCSAGQNILRLPLITFQQPPLHLLNLNPFLLFLTQTWGLRNLLSTKSSDGIPPNCWNVLSVAPYTLYSSKSGDLA